MEKTMTDYSVEHKKYIIDLSHKILEEIHDNVKKQDVDEPSELAFDIIEKTAILLILKGIKLYVQPQTYDNAVDSVIHMIKSTSYDYFDNCEINNEQH
jgi:hypothetical protein